MQAERYLAARCSSLLQMPISHRGNGSATSVISAIASLWNCGLPFD